MTKLEKTVRQTVRKYEDWAVGKGEVDCFFCENYDCWNCPIANTEPNKSCADNEFAKARDRAYHIYYNDIPSCLAIMVYVWGFVNFGINFIGKSHHPKVKGKTYQILSKKCHKRIHNK